MSSPENIVLQDKKIGAMLGQYRMRESAAHDLFECYRTSGKDQDAFVAALIGRLCVLHVRRKLPIGSTDV